MSSIKSRDLEEIKRITQYLEKQIAQKVRFQEILSMTYMKRTKFIKLFTTINGTSAIKYLRHKRMEAAKKLLIDGYSITETAQLLQYSSSKSFYKAFKQVFGMTPKKFLKRIFGYFLLFYLLNNFFVFFHLLNKIFAG